MSDLRDKKKAIFKIGGGQLPSPPNHHGGVSALSFWKPHI